MKMAWKWLENWGNIWKWMISRQNSSFCKVWYKAEILNRNQIKCCSIVITSTPEAVYTKTNIYACLFPLYWLHRKTKSPHTAENGLSFSLFLVWYHSLKQERGFSIIRIIERKKDAFEFESTPNTNCCCEKKIVQMYIWKWAAWGSKRKIVCRCIK